MRTEAELSGGATASPTAPAQPLIRARALEKWYGPHPAVRGLDFDLHPGEFVALFGPNGAGKTTLLRLLAGSLRPTRGDLRFADSAGAGDRLEWHRRTGVLSHQTFLYGQLTAEENLRFYGQLFGLPDLNARVKERLVQVGLGDRPRGQVRTFSRGMQQRLALARTLLHDPELVLLDEPYTGLDPHAARMLRGVLEHLRDGKRTIVLVTHHLQQGLEHADRVVVQAGGRWVSDERRAEIDAGSFEEVYTDRVGGVL